MQASKDFSQEGASLGRAQGTSYQKPKTPRICPAIFDEASNFISFLQLFYFISAFPSAEGGVTFHPVGCVPAAGRINSGKIHYGMLESIWR